MRGRFFTAALWCLILSDLSSWWKELDLSNNPPVSNALSRARSWGARWPLAPGVKGHLAAKPFPSCLKEELVLIEVNSLPCCCRVRLIKNNNVTEKKETGAQIVSVLTCQHMGMEAVLNATHCADSNIDNAYFKVFFLDIMTNTFLAQVVYIYSQSSQFCAAGVETSHRVKQVSHQVI